MSITNGAAEKTVRAFLDAYLKKRDINTVLSLLTDEIQWIGIGTDGSLCGIQRHQNFNRFKFRILFRNHNIF